MGKDLIRHQKAEPIAPVDPRGTWIDTVTDNLTGRSADRYRDANGKLVYYDLEPEAPQSHAYPAFQEQTEDFAAGIMSKNGRISMRLEGADTPKARRAAAQLGMMAADMSPHNLPNGNQYGAAPSPRPAYQSAPEAPGPQMSARAEENEFEPEYAAVPRRHSRRPVDPERRRKYVVRGLLAAAAVASFSFPYMVMSDDHRAPFGISDTFHPMQSPIAEDISTIVEVPGKVISILKFW